MSYPVGLPIASCPTTSLARAPSSATGALGEAAVSVFSEGVGCASPRCSVVCAPLVLVVGRDRDPPARTRHWPRPLTAHWRPDRARVVCGALFVAFPPVGTVPVVRTWLAGEGVARSRTVCHVTVMCRVEEAALKDTTGVHRVTTVGDRSLDTNSRVLAHSARVVRPRLDFRFRARELTAPMVPLPRSRTARCRNPETSRVPHMRPRRA